MREQVTADDPRLADYRELTDVALRSRWEPPHGLFIAEGELVLRRALRAGYRPRSFLIDTRRADQFADLAGAPVYLADQRTLAEITGFHVHRGVLASFHRRPLPAVADLLSGARRLVILEDLVSHTNIGAVVRAAAGLGVDAVLLTPRCADPLYRRSVRVSMGEVFAVPYASLARWPEDLAAVAAAGFTTLAMTPAADALPIHRLGPADRARTALVVGAEGPGLSEDAQRGCRHRVAIPMRNGVDSLNAAAAAAVACWELARDDV